MASVTVWIATENSLLRDALGTFRVGKLPIGKFRVALCLTVALCMSHCS